MLITTEGICEDNLDKTTVCVLLTTFNRGETTLKALITLDDERLMIDYLVIDDASTDDTRRLLREWNEPSGETDDDTSEEKPHLPHRRSNGKLYIIKGSGSLFWAGGMRKGMEMLLEKDKNYDYLLMINDDVEFYPDAIIKMIGRSKEKGNMPVTGATLGKPGVSVDLPGNNGKDIKTTTYGGVLYDMNKAKPRHLSISEADKRPVDTMNCNCFLLPWEIFRAAGVFDKHYVHSAADYDYGFRLKNLGFKVWLTPFYVGECDDNDISGTWRDTSLSRLDRLRKKESVKGLPWKQWYYYLRKNFGLRQALWHSVTPYLRILTGR